MPYPIQEQPQVVHILSVHGGQNDKDEVHVLGENQAALVQNLDIHSQGARKRRRGVQSLGARSNDPGGIWAANDLTLQQEALFSVYDGKIYAMTGGGVLFERASGISLTAAIHMGIAGRYEAKAATYIVQAVQNNSNVSLSSRIIAITDANTYTQASAAAQGGCWFQNRLWTGWQSFSGQNAETVWWSELGDGLSYSALNTLQIEPGIGGEIKQLYPLRGFTPSIVVFKERAIATIEPYWGSSSHLIPAAGDALDTLKTNIRLISNGTGCVAPLSVQFVPGGPGGDVYFLSRDGVRALTRANDDTVSGVTPPLSDSILSTIQRINFTYAYKIVSAVLDTKYHLAVPLDGATENTHVLIFDFQTQAWSVSTWQPKALVRARLTDTQDRMFMQYNTRVADCSNTAAVSAYHTYKVYVGLLDPGGAPVVFQEDSRGLDFGGIHTKKRWDWLSVSFRNDASETCVVGMQYNIDKRGWVTAGSAVFGAIAGGLDTVLAETPLPWGLTLGATRTYKFALSDADPGYFIQFRYFGTSDLAQPVVLGASVAARPLAPEFDNSIT